jgi:signal transduction histidine kinase
MQACFEPEPADTPADALRAAHDALRLQNLGMMTAGMVHDLDSMIRILSGATRVLDRRPELLASDGLELLAAGAAQSLDRARSMISLIAGPGRPAGAEAEDLDVALCLASLERLLRGMTADRIRLELRVSPACSRVNCARRDFQYALLNLVLNARDAMPDGGVLTIEAANHDARGPSASVAITITDTGVGMDAFILARAFEPVFTTKGRGSGGLGLAMVRRFVEDSGGRVIARSSPGIGTSVMLELPATTEPCGSL